MAHLCEPKHIEYIKDERITDNKTNLFKEIIQFSFSNKPNLMLWEQFPKNHTSYYGSYSI
jgi:hypothetical protein